MSISGKPFNYTDPDWKPLYRAMHAAGLPVDTCQEFMWMGEWRQGEHQYKHRDTRQYVVLTAQMDDANAAEQVHKARRWDPL